MASGKISLTRAVDFSDVSKRGVSDRCGGVELGDNVRSVNDYKLRNGKVSIVEGRIPGEEVIDVDTGFELAPQKKRKFSPITWAVKSESDCGVKGLWLSPEEGRSTLTEEIVGDDREPGQLDQEDYTRAPNISTSRWAIEDDLEETDGNSKGGAVGGRDKNLKRSSSPESGVTQKDYSDGSGRLLSSERYSSRYCGGDECHESDLEEEFMDIDRGDNKNAVGNEWDSDSDDGFEVEAPIPGRKNMLQACRSVYDFDRLGRISEGSYGIVHKARDKETGELVALKKLKMETGGKEGFPVHFLREINTQLALNHPSIVNVREVVLDDGVNDGFNNIFMVMDYVEHDLKALMKARKQARIPCFSQSEVKCLMLQLLEGVKYLHDNWVLHRDLKTSNLLLNNKGELKICDFGMARQYGSPLKPYTDIVVTLWYRAPELLLGAKDYSTAVDMWSVGCIMAELLTSEPLFDGKTEPEQIKKIFKMLGTPNAKIWPGYSELPGSKCKYDQQPFNLLHKKFPRGLFTGSPVLSDLGLDLLSRLLMYDPEKRITAEEALNHRWFQEVPLPKTKEFIPTFPADKVVFAR